VDELSQQLQEINMKVDELQNEMKSKDEKFSTLEKSISTVKERCAAKLKVCTAVCFIRVYLLDILLEYFVFILLCAPIRSYHITLLPLIVFMVVDD